jgi:transcription initiation factor TFIID subunit TAF12
VDILRILPTLRVMAGQAQAAAGQAPAAAAAAAAAGAEQQQQQQQQQQNANAAAASLSAEVSPFRPAMHGKLMRPIQYRHAQPWLQQLSRQLHGLLPSQAQLDAVRVGGATDNRLLALLSRNGFARLWPGVVSLVEILKVRGEGMAAYLSLCACENIWPAAETDLVNV